MEENCNLRGSRGGDQLGSNKEIKLNLSLKNKCNTWVNILMEF